MHEIRFATPTPIAKHIRSEQAALKRCFGVSAGRCFGWDDPKTENRRESEFNAKAQRGRAATDVNHGLHGLHGWGIRVIRVIRGQHSLQLASKSDYCSAKAKRFAEISFSLRSLCSLRLNQLPNLGLPLHGASFHGLLDQFDFIGIRIHRRPLSWRSAQGEASGILGFAARRRWASSVGATCL